MQLRAAIVGLVLLLVLSSALLVGSGSAAATHTTSSFVQTAEGLSTTMVPILASEVPTMPPFPAATRPSPVGPIGGANIQLPSNTWLHDPDGVGTGDQTDPVPC